MHLRCAENGITFLGAHQRLRAAVSKLHKGKHERLPNGCGGNQLLEDAPAGEHTLNGARGRHQSHSASNMPMSKQGTSEGSLLDGAWCPLMQDHS